MTSEVLFLCVIILVTSATTLVCQIFGNLCAKKVLTFEAPLAKGGGQRRRRRRRRLGPGDETGDDEDSFDSSGDFSDDQRCEGPRCIVSRYGMRGSRKPPKALGVRRQKPRSRLNRKDLRSARCQDGNCYRDPILNGGNTSGTFRRLGIPQEDAMPVGLEQIIHKLEDKNLSPLNDTLMSIQDSIWDRQCGQVARKLAFSPSGRSWRATSVIPNVGPETVNVKVPTRQSHIRLTSSQNINYEVKVPEQRIQLTSHLRRTSSRHFVDDVALDVEGSFQPPGI